MADWTLWTIDVARSQYDNIYIGAGGTVHGGQNMLDGDPSNVWTSTGAIETIGVVIPSIYVRGFALANCTGIAGGTLVVNYLDGTYKTFRTSGPIPAYKDWLWIHATGQTTTRMYFYFSGCSNPFSIGCLSLLADVGYNSIGGIAVGEGRGALSFGAATSPVDVGAQYPINRRVNPGVSSLVSPGGFVQSQVLGGKTVEIQIPIGAMSSANDGRWDKVVRSFAPDVDDIYTNRGWAKGSWLQMDTYIQATAAEGYYVKPSPGFDLGHSIHSPGGLASSTLSLTTLSRG
jgi:hypothetical protein